MAKYRVTYHECYNREYEVEANSPEEAEEMVENDILKEKDRHQIIAMIADLIRKK